MKRTVIETFLSRLDNSLRWTGIPALVADELSGGTVDRKHRPLRWIPMLPIVFSGALFILSLIWPSLTWLATLNLVALAPSLGVITVVMGWGIQLIGPLGKPSPGDDEREAALRKDSFLFSFGLLAWLNCLGQPLIVILGVSRHWQAAQSLGVAASALMLNFTLFTNAPTLYASWNLRQLPQE